MRIDLHLQNFSYYVAPKEHARFASIFPSQVSYLARRQIAKASSDPGMIESNPARTPPLAEGALF
jgi:hypothetical protein